MAIIGNLASSKEPVSVVATTGSYTVPVGSFAILRASVSSGRSLTINGTTVLAADNLSWSTIRNNASPVSNTAHGRAMRTFSGSNTVTNSSDVYANSTAYNRNSNAMTYKLPSGTVIAGNAYKLIEVY